MCEIRFAKGFRLLHLIVTSCKLYLVYELNAETITNHRVKSFLTATWEVYSFGCVANT